METNYLEQKIKNAKSFLLSRLPTQVLELSWPVYTMHIDGEEYQNLYNRETSSEAALIEKLQKFLDGLPIQAPFFAKIAGITPKDVYRVNTVPFYDAKSIIETFKDSMRILDLVYFFWKTQTPIPIDIRPFEQLEPRYEFRVLVKEGKIMGISQYYFKEDFAYTQEECARFEESIRKLVPTITPYLEEKSYSLDVYLADPNKTKIIELNPYAESDPCLFRHKLQDGSFQVYSR